MSAEFNRRKAAEIELEDVEDLLRLEQASDTNDDGLKATASWVACFSTRQSTMAADVCRFVFSREGRLLSHNGDIEESIGLLPGHIGQSDLIPYRVECVSHKAVAFIKRHCEATKKTFSPLGQRSSYELYSCRLFSKPRRN